MNNVNVAVGKKADAVAKIVETASAPALNVVKKDQLFQLVSELTRADLIAAGATEEELNLKHDRIIAIDADNAKLAFGKVIKGKIRDVLVEGQILGTAALVSAELDYKIVIVFTSTRTYFTLLPGGKVFGFYIPNVSKNAQEAVLNLISNNLARGKDTFEKTCNRLYPKALFLWELLTAVTPEDAVLEMSVTSAARGDAVKVPAKLFFYRDQRSKTILSIGGYCYDLNFKEYPGNFQDAFRRVKTNEGKVKQKLNVLTFEKSAQFKPKQKSRVDRATMVMASGIVLTGGLTPGSLPFNPEAPVQEVKEKPAKEKKVVEKKAPAKEGKKKK